MAKLSFRLAFTKICLRLPVSVTSLGFTWEVGGSGKSQKTWVGVHICLWLWTSQPLSLSPHLQKEGDTICRLSS